jgi:hypothetical protein
MMPVITDDDDPSHWQSQVLDTESVANPAVTVTLTVPVARPPGGPAGGPPGPPASWWPMRFRVESEEYVASGPVARVE